MSHMEPAINNEIVRQDLDNMFNYIVDNNLSIVLEMESLGRICTFSTTSDEPISYSWLKLDLAEYKGYREEGDKTKIFFFCNIYKNIYFLEEHFNYVLQSAMKHNESKTVEILKEYIKHREERDEQQQIYAEAC